jgi:hypothetical protein
MALCHDRPRWKRAHGVEIGPMLDNLRRRLSIIVLAAAIVSNPSSGPMPAATGDPLLTDLLTGAGIDIDLGSGWGAYDVPNANGRDFGTALLHARRS